LSGGGASSLPTIHNAASTYKLFAKYAYDKQTTFKVEYINDHRKTDDWTWNGTTTPYVFTDGSWLYQNPNEKVRFLGVSAQYRFQ
jgi:predicted thioredoxin/glutaredoxin